MAKPSAHSRTVVEELRVEPDSAAKLADRDPDTRVGAPSKREGLERLQLLVERLSVLHNDYLWRIHAVCPVRGELAIFNRSDEQRARLQERLDNPEKRWKFQVGDLEDRALWDDFPAAYEETISATSTEWAPWYVVPADHNWSRNLAVAEILVAALEHLDPKLPEADPAIRDLRIS